jgi:hypothetical protein
MVFWPLGPLLACLHPSAFLPRPGLSHESLGVRAVCEAGSVSVIVSSESYGSLVSTVVLELLEIVGVVAFRRVRTKPFRWSLRPSMAILFDLVDRTVAFWACVRCALTSAATRLRSATSAASVLV